MRLIFCQSYLAIPSTIQLAEESNGEFKILTSDKQAFRFFSEIYNIEQIIQISNPKPLFTKPLISLLHRILYNIRLKRKINSTMHNYRNCEVYFSLVAFAPQLAYAVKKLSRHNRVYYARATQLPDSFLKTATLNSVLNRFYIFLMWGLPTDALSNGKRLILPYSKKFFNQINAGSFNSKPDSNILSRIMKERFELKRKRVLFLSGGMPDLGIIEEKEYIDKTDKLTKLIGTDNMILKMHPRFNKKYGREQFLEEIPSYIPANLLFYLYDIIIGYQTSSLYEAANADIMAVSLLNIYVPATRDYDKKYMAYLRENLMAGKHIHFPRTFKELSAITDD